MNWHRLLLLVLWISPHVLLGLLAVILWNRRLHKKFPCYFAYVIYEIGEFLLLFLSRYVLGVSLGKYSYVYYATLMLSVALRFGVINEISGDLFRESPFLKIAARRSLQCVAGLLLTAGVLLAVYAPGGNSDRWVAGMSIVNQGAAMVQCGLLVCLLLFSRFMGLSWRRPAFGIALGFGILTSVDLAIRAVRTGFSSDLWVPYLDLLATGTYLICVSIWIGYFLAPEAKPVPLTLVADVNDNEMEIWNREFQHLLRQ
jgi:hypothetical protein